MMRWRVSFVTAPTARDLSAHYGSIRMRGSDERRSRPRRLVGNAYLALGKPPALEFGPDWAEMVAVLEVPIH